LVSSIARLDEVGGYRRRCACSWGIIVNTNRAAYSVEESGSVIDGLLGASPIGRQSSSSPEFPAYFEEIVRTSGTRIEAARKLGYRDTKTVWYHMKKLGIKAPYQWSRRPHLRLVTQRKIPVVSTSTLEERCWVAALIQGEGCIQSTYRKCSDTTYLALDIGMSDPAPILRLSHYLQLRPPSKSSKNQQWMPLWRKNIGGLRALRILQEILPFLVGQKQREAERAVDFFSPGGSHRGRFRNIDIWSRESFELRTKRRGSD
jgi:hypothetical protein